MGCCGGAKKIAHGGAGLAKAALQTMGVPVDKADRETVNARREKCRACPYSTKNPRFEGKRFWVTATSRCTHKDCGCFIQAKTMIASEKCPVGEWPAVKSE